jgi:hypothetical protein
LKNPYAVNQSAEETTTMDTRRMKALKALAVFLAFSFAQVYVQAGLPTPGGAPQQFVARLTTTGAQPITVNGASASSGATVLTGANIVTPAGVSATIDLGALGTVELKPKGKIQLHFSDDGNVRVKLIQGCAVTRKKGPGEAEAYTAEGSSEKTSNQRRQLSFCLQPNGKLSAKDPRLSTKLAP